VGQENNSDHRRKNNLATISTGLPKLIAKFESKDMG
jgi:hypothetical protein